MKFINSFLTTALTLCIMSAAMASVPDSFNLAVTQKIEKFLSGMDLEVEQDKAIIYLDFLISEEGDIYNVDFLVTDKKEIIIISHDLEEEFYRVESFSDQIVKKYSVPVSLPNA